jgi:hypothetical protein
MNSPRRQKIRYQLCGLAIWDALASRGVVHQGQGQYEGERDGDNEEKPCRVTLSKVVADRLDWPLHGSSSLLGLSVAGGIIGARAA